MDPIERARRNLEAGRSGLQDEIDEFKFLLGNTHDKGEERKLRALIRRNGDRIGAIDYALNFLENPKEEVCPD